MVPSLLVSLPLIAATVGIHASGVTWWINRLRRLAQPPVTPPSPGQQLRVLSTTATLLVLLHMSEVVVWAVTYLFLPGLDSLATFEQAVYFSTVTYTSLGYGDVVITESWRLLGAIQSMVGLLLFGWSTALLFTVVQRLSRVE